VSELDNVKVGDIVSKMYVLKGEMTQIMLDKMKIFEKLNLGKYVAIRNKMVTGSFKYWFWNFDIRRFKSMKKYDELIKMNDEIMKRYEEFTKEKVELKKDDIQITKANSKKIETKKPIYRTSDDYMSWIHNYDIKKRVDKLKRKVKRIDSKSHNT